MSLVQLQILNIQVCLQPNKSIQYHAQPKRILSSLFSRFLITSSLFLLVSCSLCSSALAESIFSTSINISSASTSTRVFFSTATSSESWTDRVSSFSFFFLGVRSLALAFLAFSLRLPSSSGRSNLSRILYKTSSITPGTALAIFSMSCLLRCNPSFFSTFKLSVFQFSIFLATELAGGQLCSATSFWLQWQISSAIMTPSAKSRWMFFLALEKGMLSTISYTSCSYYSCIQILQQTV